MRNLIPAEAWADLEEPDKLGLRRTAPVFDADLWKKHAQFNKDIQWFL